MTLFVVDFRDLEWESKPYKSNEFIGDDKLVQTSLPGFCLLVLQCYGLDLVNIFVSLYSLLFPLSLFLITLSNRTPFFKGQELQNF